jgi:MarR family 2-MHQ and catechol resistance regulon transcriptional repressor
MPHSHVPISNDVSLLPVLRSLITCHTGLSQVSSRHIASLGLTPSQFDILAVLGDTNGMNCKELGALALITKGTLIPVLDRLEAKGLIAREKNALDNRQTLISLTIAGQTLYEKTFMRHIEFMKPYFEVLSQDEQKDLVRLVAKLSYSFAQGNL